MQDRDPMQEPFELSAEAFLGAPICPFCDHEMVVDEGRQTAMCYCPTCPYITETDVYDVTRSLLEMGWDKLRAAQTAAKYVPTSGDDEPLVPDRFVVDTMAKANWVLRKMSETQARLNETQAMLDAELARIARRGEEILEPLARRLEFFRSAFGEQLQEWAREEVAGGKQKSVKLLHGKVGFRKSPDALIVDDEAAAIAYADMMKLDGAVRKSLSRTVVKDWLKQRCDAEFAGCHIESGGDKFYIDVEA